LLCCARARGEAAVAVVWRGGLRVCVCFEVEIERRRVRAYTCCAGATEEKKRRAAAGSGVRARDP
jgi:hypothetical protein